MEFLAKAKSLNLTLCKEKYNLSVFSLLNLFYNSEECSKPYAKYILSIEAEIAIAVSNCFITAFWPIAKHLIKNIPSTISKGTEINRMN